MSKSKKWKPIAIAALTVSAILIGIVIALVRHIAVAATNKADIPVIEVPVVERPQNIGTVLEDLLYIPDNVPKDMEAVSLNYYMGEEDAHFITHYVGDDDSWFEIGIKLALDDTLIQQPDQEIDGTRIAVFNGPDGQTLLSYQVENINYYVSGNISIDSLKEFMGGYLAFIDDKDLV